MEENVHIQLDKSEKDVSLEQIIGDRIEDIPISPTSNPVKSDSKNL